MKTTLEFDIPEDQQELSDAQNGAAWKSVVQDVALFVRNEIKHGSHSTEEFAVYERVRSHLNLALEDLGLRLYPD